LHALRAAVLAVVFAGSDLQAINSALIVAWYRSTPLILEVQNHLDQNTLRTVAFQPTAGLTVMFGDAGAGKTVLVYSQMNEPPSARWRVGGKTQATILRKSASTLRLDHAQFLESMFYPLW
jgi:F0F1-type ATP synthase beta subunit